MSIKSKILDELVTEKNKITSKMPGEEKKSADIYFEQVVQELNPVLEALDTLSSDKGVQDGISKAFKQEIKEQKWLEKLSEVLSLLEHSQAQTQKE